MGKKLLSIFFIIFSFFLNPFLGFGQCPTSVGISLNGDNQICAGENVIFTAEPNGGSNLQFQWQIGQQNVNGETSSTFSTTSLTNGQKVRVVVTSTTSGSETCSKESSEITMTVNPVRTPTVSISKSKTNICPGESVTFTAANTYGGTAPQYSFYLNNETSALQTGSSNTYSTSNLSDGDKIRVVLTSNFECVTSDTDEAETESITVRPGTPEIAGTISASVGTEICPGTSQTFSISAVDGASSYQWSLPSGWSGSSTSNSINVTAGTSNGSISVKAINDCGTSEAKSLAITIKAGTPAVPGTITGTASVCPGVPETYSVPAVSGATEYIWSLPNGWTGTSTNNSIDVTTGASGTGSISVQAKNDCGIGAAKTLAVSVKPGTPATPGTISGTAAVCPGIPQTYSVTTVTGDTSYIWTLPNGWTGTSTTNSITVNTGTTGGNIAVKATNNCGTSAERTLALTVKSGTPTTPGNITGPAEVCPGTTTATYTVAVVPGATSYIWTLPNGFNASSLTTTGPSITVTAGSSGSGNITVKATNDCGTSTTSNLAIAISKPSPVMIGAITGSARVCATATGLVYSIPAITNATEYIWTLPNGWTGTSNNNSITVSAGSTSSSNNTISVVAKNSCGTSSPANFTVKAFNNVPAKPGDISTTLTTAVICPPVNNIKFSVPLDQTGSTTSYYWILPTGFQVVSGSGTNEITVNITTTAAYGNNIKVEVEAVNSCGPSTRSTYSNINLDKFVVTNLGEDKTVCASTSTLNLNGYVAFGTGSSKLKVVSITSTGTNQVQGLPNGNVNDFPFQYTPSNQDLTVGKVTFTVTTETPAGSCAAGTDQMTVFFKPLPTATITATSTVCNGNTSTLTFTGTPNSRVSYRLGSSTAQTIDIPASGTINVTTPVLTANSTYSLISSVNLDTPACTTTLTGSATITVTPKPTASITYTGTPFCTSLTAGQNPTLTGTNAYTGGNYSSTTGLTIDSSTGAITPSASTPGTYIVTYTTIPAGGCAPVTATTEITITPVPTATISYAGTPFCTSDTAVKAVALTGTNGFSGGTFSAPTGLTINSSTGAVTASSSTPGTYTVTYNTPAAGGCSSVPATTEVTITKAPTVAISYKDAPFCLSDSSLKPVTITGTDAYSGGTYSAPAGLSINSSTGEINPSTSSVGTHTVTYTSPATSGCGEVTATTDVSITQTPSTEISYAGPYCTSDTTAHLPVFTNSAGSFEGGVYRSTPEGLSIDTATGAINAKNSSPNTYTVFYQLPAGAGCGTSEIETKVIITQVPQLEISYSTPFCTSDSTPHAVTFSTTAVGAYQNGSFTGTAGLDIDADGNINPSTSTSGIHTITYTTPDVNGCGPVVVTTQVEIFEKPVITTSPVNVGICSTEPASFVVVASGDNLTYQWKRVDGAAITNATGVNTAKLSFNNATATNAGEYVVVITGFSPCSTVSSEPVTLNVDENIVIIKPTDDLTFCDQERADVTFEFIAHAKGAPLTFTWIKDGADIPGTNSERFTFAVSEPVGENGEYTGTFKIVNPNPSDNGVYAVRIKGPDYFTCSEAISKTFTLNVTPLPEPPTTEPVVLCQGQTAAPLTASGATGATFKWYGSEFGNDLISGTPTPGTGEANIGTTSYWVSQTTEVCESTRTELVVTVNPTPTPPTTQEIVNYCFEEGNISALTATGTDTNATINWYGPNDSTKKLEAAPIPLTTSTGLTKYWVSQSIGECESELVEITVTIDPLPELSITADSQLICAGSSTTLRATGADNYIWTLNGEEIGTTAVFEVTPDQTATYVLTGTNTTGCQNTTEIIIEVDEPTVPGTLTGPLSVCVSAPTGTLNLAGFTGSIVRWEKTTDGSTWTNIAETTSSYTFSNLTASTSFRAIVQNGVCGELPSNQVNVVINPLPVGGELNFAGNGRVFTICENPVGNYAVDLNLTGIVGEVVRWGYRAWDATGYTTISIGGETFKDTTLTAAQIQALGFNETTVFQVEVRSGVCSPDALSKTAIISVIPSDITPKPVTVEPGVVCLGEEVTLNSETGYETGGTFLDQGAFDNASITSHDWRIRRGNSTTDIGFDTDANNVVPDRWKRATPRAFSTASTASPYSTSGVIFDTGIEDGNKGFAIVSGNNTSTMETPIFTIGSMDQAILTFDQAYVLTPGASIKVEISTDGGNSYTTLYIREVPTSASSGIKSGNTTKFGIGTIDSHPENKILIDLGDYIGRPNLRIRFNYIGARAGDIWAVDNIDIPEGPNSITMEWRDYTDNTNPEGVLIGTSNTEKWPPTQIGLNIFEVKTKLVYNSNGDACETAENAQRVEVFVFDKYTTTATAVAGSCGNLTAQLNATITNATGTAFTSFPTPDGYVGEWKIEPATGYTLIDSNADDGIAAINDPNAILSANEVGTFKASFILKPTLKNAAGVLYENKNCLPTAATHDIVFQPCTTLDFDGVDDFVDLGEGYTGDYSIEAWIRPEAATGTIISTPNLEINMGDLPGVTPNTRWYHIAVDSDGKLYIDGIASGTTISKTGTERAFIGARWEAPNTINHFSGWIEEVRIWNGNISLENIRFTMNQRLKSTGNIGAIVDMEHPDAPAFTSLAGYYQLLTTNILNGGYTLDLAGTSVNGKLRNMTTTQENTAPLPYYTANNGDWDTPETWAQPDKWKLANTGGITWNIVRTSHNVDAQRGISVLGLVSEKETLNIVGNNPTSWLAGASGTGNELYISHYLLIDGKIDLNGESQLVQPELSIVDLDSGGELHRDQQGTALSFNYNYWSSPVSTGTGNADYSIGGVMRDGTGNTANPPSLTFGPEGNYAFADGGFISPRRVSSYWLNIFHGRENVYGDWDRVAPDETFNVGEGYTMKGTSGGAAWEDSQNYTFVGIPNNGVISLPIAPEQSYLIGNPYPSSIDANKFINDNLAAGRADNKNVFNGTLYFWSHFGGKTHMLKEYEGGYAVYNLSGGIRAINTDERILNSNNKGGSAPQEFIPVGQSFFVTSVSPHLYNAGAQVEISQGDIIFNNSQRQFKIEDEDHSVFHKPEIVVKGKTEDKDHTDTRQKIWLKFQSPKGYHREILVAADANATDGFDLGYDAPMIEYNVEDMFWLLGSAELVIQGISDFNEQRIIPLGLVIDQEEKFTIKIEKLLNFEDGTPIYLKDKLNDTIHDLRKSEYVSTSEPGYINDRFELVFFKEEPPVIEVPGEIPGEEVINLTITHAHDLRQIRIINPEEMEITGVYLFDLNGNLIDSYGNLPNEKEIKLNVGSYATGVYLVKVYAKGKVITKKIIISN